MWYLVKRIPAYIYDIFISFFFTIAAHLVIVPQMALSEGTFLDVGCGTGAPLRRILSQIKAKHSKIVGVDLDPTYTEQAIYLFREEKDVEIYNMNFYEIQQTLKLKFRFIFFSFSFMLMPDQLKALEISKEILEKHEQSRIAFVMTLNESRNSWFARLKPTIKRFTSVDFGNVVYADDFYSVIDRAGLDIVKNIRVRSPWNPFLWLAPVRYVECRLKNI